MTTIDPHMISEEELLARTVFGEARGESDLGKLAVADVILNRARNPRWWGDDVRSVILKPWQFSCWNEKDPNLSLLLQADLTQRKDYQAIVELLDLHIHRGSVLGLWFGCWPITDNSDHYLVSSISDGVSWVDEDKHVMNIGAHSFYRLELSTTILENPDK